MEIKKSKINRLQLLYHHLKFKQLDLCAIQELYKQQSIIKSRRQIQRDLEDVIYFLPEDEVLDSSYKHRKKYFFIRKLSESLSIEGVYKPFLSYIESKFYCKKETLATQQKIAMISSAISEHKLVYMDRILTDPTGDNAAFSLINFMFQPEYLVFHRTSHYVAGFIKSNQEFAVFDIESINKLRNVDEISFIKNGRKKAKLNLEKRFGVSRNIDDAVYSIEIEVASVLAKFISKHHWHSSQKYITQQGKHFLLFKCGINRELLGWIFQWMYNVKVIHPPVLCNLYEKVWNEMGRVHNHKIPLVYKNLINSYENERELEPRLPNHS